MNDLEIVNGSPQDVQVVVWRGGKKCLAMVRARGKLYLMEAAPTPELEAMSRSRHLKINYRTVVNKEADDA